MLNAVIKGDYDNETSEDLLTRIETAANAIDSTQYDGLISKAMDKWLEVDNKAYLLDSIDFDNDTNGILGWFDNTDNELQIQDDINAGNPESAIMGWFDNTDNKNAWIGVDLDGTLAVYDKWRGIEHIGNPVLNMLARVKSWIAAGKKVKILTARAADKNAVPHIKKWLEKYGLGDLEITNAKDLNMVALWDDRVVSVKTNTGNPDNPVLDNIDHTHGIIGWFDNSEVA